jgi:hypothetical protein
MAPHLSLQLHLQAACPYCCRGISVLDILSHVILDVGWQSGDRIPVGGQIFRACPDWPWGPPSLLYNGFQVFPGCKEWPGRDSDPSTPSSAMVMKGYSYTSTPPMGRTTSTEPQRLYKGALLACNGYPTRPQKSTTLSFVIGNLKHYHNPSLDFKMSVATCAFVLIWTTSQKKMLLDKGLKFSHSRQ